MTKQELVSKISEVTGMSKKDSEIALNGFIKVVSETNEDIKLVGFGSFVVKDVKESTKRNPKTQEEVISPAHTKVVFKPSKALKRFK